MNTKAKLEQCQADIAKITAERDGLQEELDKLKIRHGNYGEHPYFKESRLFVRVEGTIKAYNFNGQTHPNVSAGTDIGDYIILGNIFDDLERNSKDLEKFEVETRDYPTVSVELWRDGMIRIGDVEGYVLINNIEEFAKKITQMACMAKRRQNAK